jgi:phosphomethylpyrimidine synthase
MPATPKSTKGGSRVTSLSCADHISARLKITEDVRRYAAEQGFVEDDAVKHGLEEKAAEFAKTGDVYQKV